MHGLIIVKSLLVRVFLIAHGLICAWRVVDIIENQYCWIILVGLGFLLVESGIVIWLRNGREFKTVAFCIIFYLTCTTPALWIIHVETANRKLYRLAENKLNARAIPSSSSKQYSLTNSTLFSHDSARLSYVLPTTPLILSIGHIECHDKAWYYIEEQRWLDAIQETLLIILSLSRLFIGRDYMTIEQSEIVFFISLINSVDLLSILHSLQYHDVIIERFWMYIGLILLTIGLFQMAFIDNDGLKLESRRFHKRRRRRRRYFFQDQNLWPLFRSLFIHDGLFLIYRIFLATKIRCNKPSIIFFISKNLLMIIFHSYRVYKNSQDHHINKIFSSYENSVNISLSSQNIQQQLSKKTPQRYFNSISPSISYPFVRRRNDGGRARTAFALYGLPFRSPQMPPSTNISSCSSLVAKAFAH